MDDNGHITKIFINKMMYVWDLLQNNSVVAGGGTMCRDINKQEWS